MTVLSCYFNGSETPENQPSAKMQTSSHHTCALSLKRTIMLPALCGRQIFIAFDKQESVHGRRLCDVVREVKTVLLRLGTDGEFKY